MIENRHMASLPLRVMFIFTASMTVGDKCEEQCLGRGRAAMQISRCLLKVQVACGHIY